ncbi:MAG: S24/S26 family peptidase [Lachnospiraceae bacterium]|nr:S24/S26 family peptidase [Lachnospiraceae bacterium]
MEQEGKKDIAKLLSEGKAVQISPRGYSMYPLFVPGRDEAVIVPADPGKLRPGDVFLYRREGGMLVLHRLRRRKAEGLYFAGDNQTQVEGPLKPEQVIGVLAAFVRKGRRVSVRNPVYRLLSFMWMELMPVRGLLRALLRR